MVNDLLNASFHVLFLTLLSILSPITALLVVLDSFTSACVEKQRLQSRVASKFHSVLTFTTTLRQKENDELDKVLREAMQHVFQKCRLRVQRKSIYV